VAARRGGADDEADPAEDLRAALGHVIGLLDGRVPLEIAGDADGAVDLRLRVDERVVVEDRPLFGQIPGDHHIGCVAHGSSSPTAST
jgi:hypothetical protein